MTLMLSEVKEYLRIDGTSEDALLKRQMDVAQSYLRAAVDDYDAKIKLSEATNNDNFGTLADEAALAIVSERYDNRIAPEKQHDYSYTIRSMITQLQNDTELTVTEAAT